MYTNPATARELPVTTAIHLPSLLLALAIMLCGTVYPYIFTRSDGRVDHALATALFWSMSAGLVRGVGFVPRALQWRILFSGWSCCAGLVLAVWLRFS
jgi:predicted membrane protein